MKIGAIALKTGLYRSRKEAELVEDVCLALDVFI